MANNLRTRGEKSFAVFNYIFMTLLCIICIYPLWYTTVTRTARRRNGGVTPALHHS